MAKSDFTPSTEETMNQEFERFSWVCYDQQTHESSFLETVFNIANGAELALQIVHMETLAEDRAQEAKYSKNDSDRLLLLATSSLGLLRDAALDRIDKLNDRSRSLRTQKTN